MDHKVELSPVDKIAIERSINQQLDIEWTNAVLPGLQQEFEQDRDTAWIEAIDHIKGQFYENTEDEDAEFDPEESWVQREYEFFCEAYEERFLAEYEDQWREQRVDECFEELLTAQEGGAA